VPWRSRAASRSRSRVPPREAAGVGESHRSVDATGERPSPARPHRDGHARGRRGQLVGERSIGPEKRSPPNPTSWESCFAKPLVPARVGAIVVAFFGSPVPIAIPPPCCSTSAGADARVARGACCLRGPGGLRHAASGHGRPTATDDLQAGTHFGLEDLAIALALGPAPRSRGLVRRRRQRFGRRKRGSSRLHGRRDAALFGAGLSVPLPRRRRVGVGEFSGSEPVALL